MVAERPGVQHLTLVHVSPCPRRGELLADARCALPADAASGAIAEPLGSPGRAASEPADQAAAGPGVSGRAQA